MNNTLQKALGIVAALAVLLNLSFSYALETETHKTINEYIASKTFDGFSLNSYLQAQIGFQKGVEEIFQSKKVSEWLGDGGVKEDVPYWYMPYLRSVNHFHNPLTNQGFSGVWGTGVLSGVSSIQWSQKAIATQSPGGYYSWHDVRDYFYKGLTANAKTTRDQNFADTFRGLGQLMHLLEDLSVPEHTRDDGHYVFYNYEKWVKANPGVISQYQPVYFDSSAVGNPSPLASVPVANLFDTNQYNGTNPNVTLQNNVGLSEYTNANFVSPDSEFTSSFPYPNLGSVVEYAQTISGKKRTYLRKLGQGETEGGKVGNGEHIEHLVLAGRLYKLVPSDLKKNALRPVYSDYAQKLIPRAVGYSAGLLNYFFRGQIDMVPDDVTGSGYVIVNNIDEDMNGKFELYYDNTSDQRVSINPGGWTLAIGKKSSSNNKSTNLTFTPPTDAKEPCKYILAFKGQLGQEQGAVAGKVLVLNVGICVTGRLVQAYGDGSTIDLNVYTETGLITAGFDLPNNGVAGVRFDLSNYDKIVVATNWNEFHEFTVDEPKKTISYDGMVLKLENLTDEGPKTVTRCSQSENCEDYGIYPGGPLSYYHSINNYHNKNIFLKDFYYNSSLVPFGSYSESRESDGVLGFCCGDRCEGMEDWMLERITIAGIYYGGEDISDLQADYCVGGTASSCGSWGSNCHNGFQMGEIIHQYGPIAVFNSSDYAYIDSRLQSPYFGKISEEMVSPAPLPVDLNYVKTMLRKDGGQSVYYRVGQYTWYSYSSGLGTISGQYLLSNDNPYGKHIGWDGSGNIVRCENINNQIVCNTLKHIGGYLSLVSDVSLKFPY